MAAATASTNTRQGDKLPHGARPIDWLARSPLGWDHLELTKAVGIAGDSTPLLAGITSGSQAVGIAGGLTNEMMRKGKGKGEGQCQLIGDPPVQQFAQQTKK